MWQWTTKGNFFFFFFAFLFPVWGNKHWKNKKKRTKKLKKKNVCCFFLLFFYFQKKNKAKVVFSPFLHTCWIKLNWKMKIQSVYCFGLVYTWDLVSNNEKLEKEKGKKSSLNEFISKKKKKTDITATITLIVEVICRGKGKKFFHLYCWANFLFKFGGSICWSYRIYNNKISYTYLFCFSVLNTESINFEEFCWAFFLKIFTVVDESPPLFDTFFIFAGC